MYVIQFVSLSPKWLVIYYKVCYTSEIPDGKERLASEAAAKSAIAALCLPADQFCY